MNKDELQNFVRELIEKTTIPVREISVSDDSANTWISVQVSEPHYFISRGGEGLLALNHLVRRIAESKISTPEAGEKPKELDFLIDINDFQKKRVENIRALAHMMGERARYFKSNIEIDPMSAFERRIVHEFFSTVTDLKTESIGFGPARRVVIKYIGTI